MKIITSWIYSIRHSIRKKITIILISVSILPVLLLSAIIYINVSKESEKNYINSSTGFLHNVNGRLDDYIEQLDALSLLVFYDNASALNRPSWEQYNEVLRQLLQIQSQRKEISSVFYLLDESDELYIVNASGNRSFFDNTLIRESDWYMDAMSSDCKYVIEPLRNLEDYEERYEIDDRLPVFSFSRKFNLLSKETGIISINCDLSFVERICSDMVLYEDETLQYLNQNGDMIYHQGDLSGETLDYIYQTISGMGKAAGNFQYDCGADKQKKTVVFTCSELAGTILFKTIPNHVLNSGISESMKIMSVFLGGIILGIIPLGIIMSRRVTQPLSNLQSQMKLMAQGNTRVKVSVDSMDEIGQLSQSFNQMNREINQLIDEQYRLKLSTKTAQLNSLTAQINPHFINNILQSIAGVAVDKQVPEIYEATTILAKMLRYSLKGNDKVSLKEEIENVRDYLYIQKFRYENKLLYQIEFDDRLTSVTVPKLILQPLVENAIIHGIESKKGPGIVQVSCKQAGPILLVAISDDGVGMTGSVLEAVRSQLLEASKGISFDGNHIGIRNVVQRLCLIYGNTVSVSIESSPGNGCTIVISLILKEV